MFISKRIEYPEIIDHVEPERQPAMKIAFLLTQLEMGGAQTRVFETAAELRSRGHWVDVIFLYKKRSCFETEKKIILHEAGKPSAISAPGLLAKLVNQFKSNQYDVLVTNTAPANILGSVCGRIAGLNTRISVQTQPPQRVSAALRFLDRQVGSLGFYTVNIANSDWTRSCFTGYNKSYLQHMKIVKDGISPPFSTADRQEARYAFGIKQDDFVVMNVGRLSPQKGQATLVSAMSQVDGRLVIAGEGELRPDLEHQIANAGLQDRVTLLGEIPRTRVGLVFRAADVFAFSSRWETFGLALIEAAANGLPLVATGLDVSREVLGAYAESALFVEPGDSGGFAEALNRLRNNPALRASMSANSLRTADLYTIKRHTDRLLEVFGQE